MQPETTQEELDLAYAHYHQQAFAEFILHCLAFAAHRDPGKLRDALKEAFSTEALEDQLKRTLVLANEATALLRGIRTDIDILKEELARWSDDSEKRLDGLNEYLDRLRNKLSSIKHLTKETK